MEISTLKQGDAAELLNVSRDLVISGKKVLDHGAPALVESVQAGRVAVSTAQYYPKDSVAKEMRPG